MNRRWPDIGTIACAFVVPVVLSTVFLKYDLSAESIAARECVTNASIITTILWWLLLLGWAVLRLFRGPAEEGRGKGLRIAALVVVAINCPLVCGVSWIPGVIFRAAVVKETLLHKTDHKAVAQACADILSDYRRYKDCKWDDPAIPKAVRDIKPRYLAISEKSVTMEMHGGFDHYGLAFRPESTNTWCLCYYTEGGSKKLIAGVVVKGMRNE